VVGDHLHTLGGETVTGAENVATYYLDHAMDFHSTGTSRFDVINQGSGELGFWTGFQIATVQLGKATSPQNMRLRVTEVLRKKDGEWKIIHRHADTSNPSLACRPAKTDSI
jgi:ketosteroid isomerase-like protein